MSIYRWIATNGQFGIGSSWANTTLRINPARTPPGLADTAEFVTGGGTVSGVGAVASLGVLGGNTTIWSFTAQLQAGSSLFGGAAEVAGGGSLDGGATSIGTSAVLTVQNGGVWRASSLVLSAGATLTVAATGVATVGKAAGAAGLLTVDGSLSGAGTVDAAGGIVDLGTVSAAGGTLSLNGPVSGGGSLQIGAGATLALNGVSTAPVIFNGAGGTLRLGATPSGLAEQAVITGFAAGDTISYAGAGALTSATLTAGSTGQSVLALFSGASRLGSLTLAGDYSGFGVTVSPQAGAGVALALTAVAPPTTPTPTPPPPPTTPASPLTPVDVFVPPIVVAEVNHVVGSPGHDIVDLSGSSVRGSLFSFDGTMTMRQHGGQTDTYQGVRELRFLDGRIVLDLDDPAAQTLRMYRAAFGRTPDQDGLNGWISRLETGASLGELGSGFAGSAEFAARFGSLDDAGYVDRLYQNVLGRPGDTAGRAFWLDRLGAGISRGEVLAGFSEGTENRTQTAALVGDGIWDRSETAEQVARLYDTVFGRLPDAAGLAYWRGMLDAGTASLDSIAGAFSASPEFAARFGGLGNRDFVEALYRNTLGRASDPAGAQFWTSVLDDGSSPRGAVVVGFSESAEHVARTAPQFASTDPSQFGIALAA